MRLPPIGFRIELQCDVGSLEEGEVFTVLGYKDDMILLNNKVELNKYDYGSVYVLEGSYATTIRKVLS